MTWKSYLLLSLIGALVLSIPAIFQISPGYMDAEYYAGIGRRLAAGKGLTEPFLWNYLGKDLSLPRPAFGYWQPLTSLVAAIAYSLAGSTSFRAAQAIFFLLSIWIPPLTAALAYQLSGDKRVGIFSGFTAVFSGFYAPFLTTTDSFSIYMLGGCLILLLVRARPTTWQSLGIGIIAGLMHLTRAEGFLWAAAVLAVGIFFENPKFLRALWVLVGYSLVILPWLIRNTIVFGGISGDGGSQMLWLTTYNELFSYPAELVNPQNWVDQGLRSILLSQLSAVWTNLKTFWIVQGQIILAPLMMIGFWKSRTERKVLTGVFVWVGMFLIMSLVFPHAGSRGGYFHAGAGVQPLFWALAGIGMKQVIDWAAEHRGWRRGKNWKIIGSGWIVILLGMTVYLVNQRVIGQDWKRPVWNASYRVQRDLAGVLESMNYTPESLVMINNPPGLYYAAGVPAIVIPNGGVETLERAAGDFQVEVVILEQNHPAGLEELYQQPRSTRTLDYICSRSGARFFSVTPQGGQE